MLQKLASFTAKVGAFCYSKGQLEGSVQEGAGVSKQQSLIRPPIKISCPVVSTLHNHCCVQRSGQSRDPLLGLPGLFLPTPPLTRDSLGTTFVRQRLSHQVPCIRSQARTIYFSLTASCCQGDCTHVQLQEICCAQATSKTEDLHPAPLSKKLGQFSTYISYFLPLYTTPCCWPPAE